MARILFLTQVLPYPLDSGARIRAYYVLRYLAQQHQVTLLSFVRADDRPQHLAHLEGFCRAVHTVPMPRSALLNVRALVQSLRTGQPVVICRDCIPAMAQLVEDLLATDHASRITHHASRITPFDVVHADQTSMAQYGLLARNPQSAIRSPQLVLDAHNALYRILQRLAAHERNPLKRRLLQREARALLRYEVDTCQSFDHVVFVTEEDRQALTRHIRNPQSAIRNSVIPICVDAAEQPLLERVPHPRAITHLGTMFWPPNVEGVLWFAEDVLPLILEQIPEAQLIIIGKDPPSAVQRLATPTPDAHHASRITHHASRITVTGYVPDPTPYLRETAAFIVPVHSAGGMRVKILDGWCWGAPIVSTSIGAEGIAVRDGENILVADTAENFAQAVVRLLQEPTLGEQLRQNGRRWVEERYDWRRVYTRWDEVYQRLMTP